MKILRTNYEKEEKSALKNSGMARDSMGHIVVRPDIDIQGADGVPEWGNVQFSLSFPLPVDSYLDEKGAPVFDKFWDLPEQGTERYKGIFRLKTQAPYDAPWLPMTFYNKENARFGEEIAATLGCTGNEAGVNCKNYSWITPAPVDSGQEVAPDASLDARLKFFLPLEGDYKINGGIELVSFEVLQYHDEICTDSPYQRYLVLHYVGVDCTNSQIEAISRALTRPRNKLITIGESIDLLSKSCEFITDILNKSENVPGRYIFKCTKGGYLDSEKFSLESKALSEKQIYDYPLPARSVCAIPNIPIADFSSIPAIFSNYESQKISEYSKTNLWAAQLARGFDNFSSEVPTLEAIESTLSTEHQLKKWLITAEGSGIVAIRTDPHLLQDLSLWSLASTRFVDLLILNQRTYTTLRYLSSNLRKIKTQALGGITTDSEQRRSDYREKLLMQFNQLMVIQNQLAEFRNSLWFNAIPRRQVDTYLLLRMRAETGVQNLYEDMVDEVQFRHRIYDLTYHEFESDQRQKEALEREALATERRQEREKAEQERIKQENDRRIQAEKDAKQREEIAERQRKIANRQQNITLALTIISAIAIPASLFNDGLDVVHKIINGEYQWSKSTCMLLALAFVISIGIFFYRRYRFNEEEVETPVHQNEHTVAQTNNTVNEGKATSIEPNDTSKH